MFFRFKRARLQLGPKLTLPPPAIGQGWFENWYADETIRIAHDSRGSNLLLIFTFRLI